MATHAMLRRWMIGAAALLGAGLVGPAQDPAPRGPVKVTVREDKPVVQEVILPVDPTPMIRYDAANLGASIRDANNQTLHLSHFPMLNIDNQAFQPGGFPGGRFEKLNQPLQKTAGGKVRQGFTTTYLHNNDVRVTLTAELVPGKAKAGAQKRKMDSLLMRYQIENIGKKNHKVGLRIYMDVFVINNDGALFAAPTMPNRILDGMVLKDKTLPDYLQMLQMPDLKNPGYVSHMTFNLGLEKPDRVVLTRHGQGFGGWDMQAVASMGDSACGVFWEPKELRPGQKRDVAYAYGAGVAEAIGHEGRFDFDFGGSFEPGKLFTVSAKVYDPSPGQALTLELPKGMQMVEGREIQPVRPPLDDQPYSMVMWKARVLEVGEFPIRMRSNLGITQSKLVKVEKQ